MSVLQRQEYPHAYRCWMRSTYGPCSIVRSAANPPTASEAPIGERNIWGEEGMMAAQLA